MDSRRVSAPRRPVSSAELSHNDIRAPNSFPFPLSTCFTILTLTLLQQVQRIHSRKSRSESRSEINLHRQVSTTCCCRTVLPGAEGWNSRLGSSATKALHRHLFVNGHCWSLRAMPSPPLMRDACGSRAPSHALYPQQQSHFLRIKTCGQIWTQVHLTSEMPKSLEIEVRGSFYVTHSRHTGQHSYSHCTFPHNADPLERVHWPTPSNPSEIPSHWAHPPPPPSVQTESGLPNPTTPMIPASSNAASQTLCPHHPHLLRWTPLHWQSHQRLSKSCRIQDLTCCEHTKSPLRSNLPWPSETLVV